MPVPQSPEPGKPDSNSFLDRLASTADKLDKIWSFGTKIGGVALAVLVLIYSWLGERAVVVPRPLLQTAIGLFTMLGVAVWFVTYWCRARVGRWTVVAMASAGSVCFAIAVAVWWLLPSPPTWQRVNAVQVTAAETDLPLLLLRSELTGDAGIMPGGGTYKKLLDAKRGAADLQEPWAAY